MGKLQIPAIGMLGSAVLNVLVGFILTLSGIFRLTVGWSEEEALPVDPAERFGFLFATIVIYGIGILSVIFAPVILYGTLKMMGGKRLKLAKTAAILSVLPLSCLFPLSGIFGIWTLVVLSKPEVKSVFQDETRQTDFPPPPPQDW